MKRTYKITLAAIFVSMGLFVFAGNKPDIMTEARDAYRKENFDKALRLFLKISDDIKAQVYLGYMYENGLGVQQDYAEAAKWYRKSAEQGNPEAQKALERLKTK